ncbi:MAG: glycosyltransferase [Myxococcales bacterium]|nr:glycosyltransferase [Myxococcales bacterium]
MRVALVHDWLTGLRGGERVLHEFALEFPDADLYTLIHVPGSTTRAIERLNVRASFLSRLPGSARHYRKLLPLFPRAIESFELKGYDLVLSSSHAFAKGIRISGGTPHLCYCHTPMRYVWDQADAYLGRGALRLAASPLVAWLRRWDRRTSSEQQIDRVVANSAAVADRIRRCWGRQASVIHPPVDVDRIRPSTEPPENFFLLVGGFVPYKREELAIAAFAELALPLVVAGDGPSRARLEANAPPQVRFTGRVSDAELASLYARCRALVYPQEEDFGIVAVEAQAAGRPVIAYGRGGVRDTVVADGSGDAEATGIFFDDASPAALAEAVREFEKRDRSFDPAAIRRHAERFGRERFRAEIIRAVYRTAGIDRAGGASEAASDANSSTSTEPPG